MYYLYHICRAADVGNLKVGYIGISKDVKKRWKGHRSKTNAHLQRALKAYDDIVWNVISEGSKEEILRMEVWLRPDKDIGWNIAAGGGLPPNLKGHKWSEETQAKRTTSLKGRKQVMTPAIKAANERKLIRPFKLIDPDGVEHTGNHLRNKCEELGIPYLSMRVMVKGERKQNGGWTGYYLDDYEGWLERGKRTWKPKKLFK